MKRKMISVLALALIVLMSVVLVSCEDMLPTASPEIVNYVDEKTLEIFNFFGEYIEALLDGTATTDEIEDDIKLKLAAEFSTTNVSAQADPSNPATLSASATADNQNLSVIFSNITKSLSNYKGNFSFEASLRSEGVSHKMKLKGSFDTSSNGPVFTSVNYNGTDYDVDAFNNAFKSVLYL